MSQVPLLTPRSAQANYSERLQKDERLPFSRMRCIWDPYKALDRKRSLPFARLLVVVDRATGLLGSDMTGLSDAYVQLELNDGSDVVRTRSIPQTLAPTWGQAFEFDVYCPESVLTLKLFDEDYGTALGGLDLLGLDDDFIGFLDLRVWALPLNQRVAAWMDLDHPDIFEDTITERMQRQGAKNSPKTAGRIRVELQLRVAHTWDRNFAMCLNAPHLAKPLPPLDLGNLYVDGIRCSEEADRWISAFQRVVRCIDYNQIPVLAFLLYVIWYPRHLFTGLLGVFWVALLRGRWELLTQPATRGDQKLQAASNGALKQNRVVDEGTQHNAAKDDGCIGRLRRGPKKQTKNKDPSTSQWPPPPAPGSPTRAKVTKSKKTLRSTVKQKQDHQLKTRPKQSKINSEPASSAQKPEDLADTLRSLQHMMPPDLASSLRLLGSTLRDALAAYTALADLLLDTCTWCIFSACWWLVVGVLILHPAYQIQVLQIAVSIVLLLNFLPQSMPGRIITAVLMARKLRGSQHGVWETCALRLSPRVAGGQEKTHVFKAMTLNRPTWCSSCGHFLWGVYQQGHGCKICGRIVCDQCVHAVLPDDCVASSKLDTAGVVAPKTVWPAEHGQIAV